MEDRSSTSHATSARPKAEAYDVSQFVFRSVVSLSLLVMLASWSYFTHQLALRQMGDGQAAMRNVNWMLLLAWLLVLTLIGIFVFRPMLYRLHIEARQINADNLELEKRAESLKLAAEALEASQRELRRKSDLALSMVEDLQTQDAQLKREAAERLHAQELLREAHAELEGRVRQRTTELVAANESLRESEERFRSMADSSPVMIWVAGPDKKCTYLNRSWLEYSGRSLEEELGFGWVECVHPEDRDRVEKVYLKAFEERVPFQFEYRVRRKDGVYRWLMATANPRILQDGRMGGYVGSSVDISDHKSFEEQLQRFAYTDHVTGLPNRMSFVNRLGEVIAEDRDRRLPLFAVLFLDLDRFKNINDSLGHMIGDMMLRGISERLKQCVPDAELIARLGGDEFVVLLKGLSDADHAMRIASLIEKSLSQPIELDGRSVFSTASIGVTLSSNGYRNVEEMIRDADTAMYEAKSNGKARCKLFHRSMHARVEALLELETDLRQAVTRNELELYYQPVVCLNTGCLCSMEVLIRWNHPKRGLLPPGEFIPMAEETDLIVAVDRWVFREACRKIVAWNRDYPGDKPLSLSVNFSARGFTQPNLAEELLQIMHAEGNGQPPAIRIEFTESMFMDRSSITLAQLDRLKEAGIHFYMDDFGTGYASLSALRELPVDVLKIDKSFLLSYEREDEKKIIETTVKLGHELGLKVIAEGVETLEQVRYLQSIGCDLAQGYYFSKPVNVETATGLIAGGRRWNPL